MTTALLPLLILAAALPKVSMIPTSTALDPEAALASFEVAGGLQVELVASEPLVMSPVAMAFDDRGRLFVVEMPGFPLGSPPGEKPVDRIALLEDTDRDGRMDRRTVYADGLAEPMGVLPWQDGIIVTVAPDVLFLRDTDGDGKADQRRVLFTGFSTKQTPALRMNCPLLGPDGWIYIASGQSGGTITTPEHPERPALEMTADVRFHPETLVIENVDGRSQYGISFDAAGRRFLCNNRMPVMHVVAAAKWWQRNPHLRFSQTVQECNERSLRNTFRASGSGGGVPVFPLTSHFVNVDAHIGSVTAACSILVWRGNGLPDQYKGAAFTCEPTANLVRVDRLIPDGATFAAAPMFEGREFLASRDDWFRPVFLTHGRDGALYITDMYRKIIEHIDYLPEEVRKYADVTAGQDRGRIWRVVSRDRQDREGYVEPVVATEAWVDRPCPSDPSAAERWLHERLAAARSPDSRKRFLGAIALGESRDSRATAALAGLAARDFDDRWMRAAVLSGARGREAELLRAVWPELRTNQEGSADFLATLGRGFPDRATIVAEIMRAAGDPTTALNESVQSIASALLLGHAEEKGITLEPDPAQPVLTAVLEAAQTRAVSSTLPTEQRIIYVRLLGRTSWATGHVALRRLALKEPNESIREAAVRALAGFERSEVAPMLLDAEHWAAATPAERAVILSALLRSDIHRRGVLDAIESGAVSGGAITGVPRRQLLNHKDPEIRKRAERLWAGPSVGSEEAMNRARESLSLSGDSARGRELFRAMCATCHRLDQEGHNVGPDLADMRRQDKATILYHIVAPDAEIVPMYTTYIAETKEGRTFGGILTSESANFITLQGPLAHEENISRQEIVRLQSLPTSLMPSGLDAAMTPQQLADLLAYLRGEE